MFRKGRQQIGITVKDQSRNGVGCVERLEPRMLLYAANGGLWPHPELVTVSFMPDGSDVGGTPSGLIAKMNSKWSTATWQKELLKSLQVWAQQTNLNFSLVADDGSPFGSAGYSGTDNNEQGDSNFGDVRIGGFDLGSNLGIGVLPPPVNRDTTAGDVFLNTTTSWNIGSSYDLFTVASHEAGHVLGLSHSSSSSATMYSGYTSTKSALSSDDINGIRAIYGDARSSDSFDASASNGSRATATVITGLLDNNQQVNLTGLDITTTSDVDYYKITTPSGSSGTMTIQMQSAGLSLLSPMLKLYNSGGTLLKSVTGTYHSTVSLTYSFSGNQTYYISADGAENTAFGIGAYALQVNLGTAPLPTITGPNTGTAASGAGGTSSSMSSGSSNPVDGLLNAASGVVNSGLNLLLGLVAQGKAEAFGPEPEEHGEATEHQETDTHSHSAPDHSFSFTVIAPSNAWDTHSSLQNGQGAEQKIYGELSSSHCWTSPGVSVCLTGASTSEYACGASGVALPAVASDQREAQTVDHIFDTDPVDVVRPKFDLVCDLTNRL